MSTTSSVADGTTGAAISATSSILTTNSLPAIISTNIGSSPGTAAAAVPLSHTVHSVAIKSLVLYTLDMESYNYTKWRTLFSMVLGRFNLLHHIEDYVTHPDDIE
jgi:hypothetical protein